MFKYLVDELNKGRTLHGDTTQSAVISMVTALLIGCRFRFVFRQKWK